jgi:cytochrome c
MDNRTNVIAMMVLGAGIVALGATLVSSEIFKVEKPEKPGYIVEGVVEDAGPVAPVAQIPIATLLQTADVAKGAEVFKKCASCHNAAEGGANGTGPNLWGVLGKPHGAHPGFTYSEAMKAKTGNWDFEAMNEWLLKPSAYVPGTKMGFAGLSKGEDRANVIAYLNAQGSNLPMPPAPKADASAAAAPAAAGNTTAGNVAAPAGAPVKK